MRSASDKSEALHARVRRMIGAFERGEPMPEGFDALGVDIARFQAEHVAGYGRLCAARNARPAAAARLGELPAVPTDAFKAARVFAFGDEDARVVFRTSGTTIGSRGAHAMRSTETYDAAALAFGRAMLLADRPPMVRVIVLGPSPAEAPDSSLAHMCDRFARVLGEGNVRDDPFFIREGRLDVASLAARLRGAASDVPVVVLAATFALVHLLDALGRGVLPLPRGSRVMQTGGHKGRSREVPAGALRRDAARVFAIDESAIVGEYGMTELSSQLWETTLVPGGARGVYAEPPWARVVPVDPETLAPVADGAVGLARIEDLANVDSAVVILAQDRVRRVPGGVEVLGRATGAPPRGCSIAVDEMLGGGGAHGR